MAIVIHREIERESVEGRILKFAKTKIIKCLGTQRSNPHTNPHIESVRNSNQSTNEFN